MYGVGIDWAGLVVEQVTGQRLNDYFDEHVFAPLGMQDTTFYPRGEQVGRLARLYLRADGALAPAPVDPSLGRPRDAERRWRPVLDGGRLRAVHAHAAWRRGARG